MKKDQDLEYDVLTLNDYEAQLWSCYNCFCGLAMESCPAYRCSHKESLSARGLAQIGLAVLSGELNISDISNEILYSCSGCNWCESICSMNTPFYIQNHDTRKNVVSGATMAELLRLKKIEEGGRIPPEVKNVLVSLGKYGNPYGVGENVKDKWIDELGVNLGRSDTILYVGATVPYDNISKNMAEAVIHVLKAGNLDFGMLGSKEMESGTFSRAIGDEWQACEMAKHNQEVFREEGVQKIICLSPHDYDMFLNNYEEIENIEVIHFTEVIWDMLKNEKILFRSGSKKKVTYHDPCYLSRRLGILDEPREIIRSVPNVDLVEMDRSRENTLCCGGGGSGLFLELPGIDLARRRVDEIEKKNVDAVIVCCPNCYQMLDSAVKGGNYDFEVMDIAELVRNHLA